MFMIKLQLLGSIDEDIEIITLMQQEWEMTVILGKNFTIS
jgi:hypothetical protein